MKTLPSLVLAPAVAAAVTGMIAAPAVATSTSPAPNQDPTSDDASAASNESSPKKITVTDTTVSVADISDSKKGVTFKGENFKPNTTARVFATGPNGQQYPANTELSVNDKGEVNGTYYFTVEEGAEVPVGRYSIALRSMADEKNTDPATFSVTQDGEEPAPEATPAPEPTQEETPKPEATPEQTPTEQPTPEETKTPAETPTAEPTPEAPATETPSPEATPEETQTQEPTPEPKQTPTETPSAQPSETPEPEQTPTETPSAQPSETPKPEPTPEKTPTSEPTPEETPTSEATPEAPAADASLSISPSKISAEAFGDKNKGVNATVTGLKAGSKYTFKFEHSKGKTSAYEVTKTADEKGVATAGVAAGEGSEVHPGKYTVTVTGDDLDKPLTGSFTVLPPQDDAPDDKPEDSKPEDNAPEDTPGTSDDGGHSTEIDNSRDDQGDASEDEQEDSEAPAEDDSSGEDTDAADSDESSDSGESEDSTDTSRRPAEERAPRHGENTPAPESNNDLPRTGTELTGLALGVGLIVVGGAAVVVTRRKAATDGTF